MNGVEPDIQLASGAQSVTGAPKSAYWRKAVRLTTRVAVTAFIVILLFRQVHWQDIWAAVFVMDRPLLLAACVLWIPTQWLQFKRWDLLARSAGVSISRREVHRGYWVGFTLGLVTPGRVGEYGRALALHNCPLARAVGVSVLERTYSAIVMNGTGLLTLAFFPVLAATEITWLTAPHWRVLLVAAGSAILAFGINPGTAFGPLSWISARLPWRDKLLRGLEVLREVSPARGTLLLLLSVAALASALLQYAILLRALDAGIGLIAGMLAALLTFFIKGALPITIGSLGIAEWAAVVVFGYFGVIEDKAVAASLMLFVLNVLIPGLIGMPCLSALRVPSLIKPVKAVA